MLFDRVVDCRYFSLIPHNDAQNTPLLSHKRVAMGVVHTHQQSRSNQVVCCGSVLFQARVLVGGVARSGEGALPQEWVQKNCNTVSHLLAFSLLPLLKDTIVHGLHPAHLVLPPGSYHWMSAKPPAIPDNAGVELVTNSWSTSSGSFQINWSLKPSSYEGSPPPCPPLNCRSVGSKAQPQI